MDDKKLNIIIGCVGLLISVCLVFFGIQRLNRAKSFERKAVEIQTTVSQVTKRSGNYDIWVSYEYNGMKYQNVHLTRDGSFCQVGDVKTVLIDPDHPNVCATGNSLSPASYAFIGGGILLGLIMISKIIQGCK